MDGQERPRCNVPGCEAEGRLRGLCRKHYMQWWGLKRGGQAQKAQHKKLVASGVVLQPYQRRRSDIARLAESLDEKAAG